MSKYCVYNEKTKYWESHVPIWCRGISLSKEEFLGQYRDKDSALKAVKDFFEQAPSSPGLRKGDDDKQRIVALRIRVASLEKENNLREKEYNHLFSSYKILFKTNPTKKRAAGSSEG